MDNEKIIKLLQEIRDTLKENQKLYDKTLQTQKEMNRKHLKNVLIVVIVFMLLAILVVPFTL